MEKQDIVNFFIENKIAKEVEIIGCTELEISELEDFIISSVAGKKGWPNATAYCATKFAMTGFTQALNGEGKPYNIRCSIVYPGGMDTEWHMNPNPKRIDPEAVANFLVHMATQDPRFVVNEAVVSPINEGGYP